MCSHSGPPVTARDVLSGKVTASMFSIGTKAFEKLHSVQGMFDECKARAA